MISGQDGGEDGTGIQFHAGQEPQFAQSRRAHLLCFIDQEHRTIQRVLDVMEPLFPQNFGTGPSVVRSQGDRKQVAQLAKKSASEACGRLKTPTTTSRRLPRRSTRMRRAALLPVPGSPIARAKPPSPICCSMRQQKLSIAGVLHKAEVGTSGENGLNFRL